MEHLVIRKICIWGSYVAQLPLFYFMRRHCLSQNLFLSFVDDMSHVWEYLYGRQDVVFLPTQHYRNPKKLFFGASVVAG